MAKHDSSLALPFLHQLTDHELLARVHASARGCRQGLAQLLAELGEVDVRGPALLGSYSSLFSFCVERLGFSEGETQNRIISARAARKFPVVVELVASGRIHLTGVRLLAPYLTESNHRSLLDAACGKTARRIKEVIAERFPQPDVPSTVRKLPESGRGAEPSGAGLGGHRASRLTAGAGHEAAGVGQQAAVAGHQALGAEQQAAVADPANNTNGPASPMDQEDSCVALSTPRAQGQHGSNPVGPAVGARPTGTLASKRLSASVSPLSAARYKVQFTAGGPLRAKIEEAEALCSHVVSPGDLAVLFERALDVLIAQEKKRRFAVGVWSKHANPEDGEPAGAGGSGRRRPSGSRYVPARVRRRVWERDGGQCAFVDSDGRRCPERRWLKIEHIQPHALGGPPTLENLELLCHSHNQARARQIFGVCTGPRKAPGASGGR